MRAAAIGSGDQENGQRELTQVASIHAAVKRSCDVYAQPLQCCSETGDKEDRRGGAGSAQQQDPGIDRCESLSQAVPAAAFRQGLVTADPAEVIDAGGQHEQFEW